MSRTRQNDEGGSANPATRFLRWKSSEQAWVWYDKEKEANCTLPMETPFIVLDQLATVSGFDERKNAGIWSNEVRSIQRDVLHVHAGKEPVFTGVWREVKANITGAEFASSVYALAKIGDEYQLVNFQIKGCALGPWIDFVKDVGGTKALYENTVIAVTDTEKDKKGATEFYRPVFRVISKKLSPEASAQADEADKKLQAYLDGYFKAASREEPGQDAASAEDAAPEEAPEYNDGGEEIDTTLVPF